MVCGVFGFVARIGLDDLFRVSSVLWRKGEKRRSARTASIVHEIWIPSHPKTNQNGKTHETATFPFSTFFSFLRGLLFFLLFTLLPPAFYIEIMGKVISLYKPTEYSTTDFVVDVEIICSSCKCVCGVDQTNIRGFGLAIHLHLSNLILDRWMIQWAPLTCHVILLSSDGMVGLRNEYQPLISAWSLQQSRRAVRKLRICFFSCRTIRFFVFEWDCCVWKMCSICFGFKCRVRMECLTDWTLPLSWRTGASKWDSPLMWDQGCPQI